MFYFGTVSDLSGSWAMQRQQQSVKSQLNIASQELASGIKDMSKIANAGDIGRVLAIDKTLEVNERYAQAMSAGKVRLDTTQETLSVIRDEAHAVALGLLEQLGSGVTKSTEIEAATAIPALTTAMSRLNAHVGGRSIFAGADIDGAAIADAETLMSDIDMIVLAGPDAATILANVEAYFNTPGGTFETSIYLGSANDAPDVSIGEGETVKGAIRADAQPLRDVLRQLSIIASVARNSGALSDSMKETLLQTVSEQNLETTNEITLIQERLGFDEQRIALSETRNESERMRLMISRTDITQADQFETAGKFEELKTQLQVIFAVTARLGDMSLVNYLR